MICTFLGGDIMLFFLSWNDSTRRCWKHQEIIDDSVVEAFKQGGSVELHLAVVRRGNLLNRIPIRSALPHSICPMVYHNAKIYTNTIWVKGVFEFWSNIEFFCTMLLLCSASSALAIFDRCPGDYAKRLIENVHEKKRADCGAAVVATLLLMNIAESHN